MPFTPAHAAVALPFIRSPLPTAAIAIGAMTPDVPLFFRVGVPYALTHDAVGIVVADLPIALVLLLIWRVVLRPAVSRLVPRWFAQRCPPEWADPFSGWAETWGGRSTPALARLRAVALLVAALLLGIASHLLWDAFTHEGRWGSGILPILTAEFAGRLVVSWAQHVSSIAGFTAIAIVTAVVLRRTPPRPRPTDTPGWVRAVAWAALPASLLVASVVVAAVAGGPDRSGGRSSWSVWGRSARADSSSSSPLSP